MPTWIRVRTFTWSAAAMMSSAAGSCRSMCVWLSPTGAGRGSGAGGGVSSRSLDLRLRLRFCSLSALLSDTRLRRLAAEPGQFLVDDLRVELLEDRRRRLQLAADLDRRGLPAGQRDFVVAGEHRVRRTAVQILDLPQLR